MPGDRRVGEQMPRRFPEPALGPVAGDGVADPSGRGEAEADFMAGRLFPIGTRTRLQHEGRRDPTTAGRGDRQKFDSALETNHLDARDRGPVLDGLTSAIVRDTLRLRRRDAFAPWPVSGRGPDGRRPRPSARENRGGACERDCWAGMCVSRDLYLRRTGNETGALYRMRRLRCQTGRAVPKAPESRRLTRH